VAEPRLCWVPRRRCGFQICQAIADTRNDLGDIGGAGAQVVAEGAVVMRLDDTAHDLRPGPIGRRTRFLMASPPDDLRAFQ
jgi:hypothetical protein